MEKDRQVVLLNTVIQITSDNPVIAISMNKNNYTYDCIKRTGRFFCIQFYLKKTTQNVIAKLGFSSGRDTDKFDGDIFCLGIYGRTSCSK